MVYIIPVLLSFAVGYLALRLLLRKYCPPLALLLFLGASAGMGLSAAIVFSSLVFLGKLAAWYAIGIHILLLVALAALTGKLLPPGQRFPLGEVKGSDLVGLSLLGLCMIPVVSHALLYPQGGWDAWSCWNLKARFIFLGGEDWKNMFDPLLWRSNIAYPLLLPCLNVWSWCFGKDPAGAVPLANSCLITFVTAGTLLFSIKKLAGRLHAILAPVWLLSILFAVKLASSQYSDLMVGNYYLAAAVAYLYFEKTGARAWLAVTALMLGFLSFTKSEGLVLALVTAFTVIAIRAVRSPDRKELRRDAAAFFVTLIAASLPTIIFLLGFAPDSHTFINGFTSSAKPTGLERLQFIFAFWGVELISWKWNGFWILSAAGLLLSRGKCLRKSLWIFPATLLIYCLAVIGVYWTNTFFEIGWWLSTTLNRILFALAPSIILWVFLALE